MFDIDSDADSEALVWKFTVVRITDVQAARFTAELQGFAKVVIVESARDWQEIATLLIQLKGDWLSDTMLTSCQASFPFVNCSRFDLIHSHRNTRAFNTKKAFTNFLKSSVLRWRQLKETKLN